MGNLEIKPATRMDCAPYILGIHYAKRFPSVSYAFALYRDGVIVGVVTYGTPASSPLRKGIAGKENSHHVLELNRLCLRDNLKNEASQLIAGSIKMLPARKIIISFADTEQGHRGIVYQAKGKEHLHGQTIADEFRGVKNRAAAMRQKYGDDFYLKPRARKHRYIFLHGPKLWKKRMSKNIRYPEQGLIKPTI